jgi:predicted CXXCH cytochrome family protein
MKRSVATLLAMTGALLATAPARAGLRETVHNLSPGGAGRQASGAAATAGIAGGGDLCVFCHTPHSASGQRGLWNRSAPPLVYKLYESSTSEANLQQPTGSSRLCLSCHDGMVAVGAMRRHGDPSLGKLTGSSVLGTDLSDDHPISFVYDSSLVARRRQLANPHTLNGPVKLDESGQMQCTSCHDAHLDRYPQFLVMDPAYSSLCTTCHQIPHWPESAHATSSAATALGNDVPGLGFATVGQNGCASCHRNHGAPHPEFLLTAASEEGVCLVCHDGQIARSDLRRELNKPSAHRVDRYSDIHDPTENPNTMPPHVECADCHAAHQARGENAGELIPGPLFGASGLSITSSFTPEASFEYEVCLKCHGVAEDPDPIVFRDDAVTNVRLEIDPRNQSFHPVADIGRNPDVPGLISPLSAASRTPCTSCHGNDATESAAPRGPHGSRYRPILAAEYHLDAISARESYQRYALCYGCHDRNTLLNRSGGFPHRLHVDEAGASCAVCHDAHGSRDNAHLVNFMIRDYTGASVVTPSAAGVLAYDSLGMEAGRCSLTCHGSNHDGATYPQRPGGAAASAPLRGQRRRPSTPLSRGAAGATRSP